MSAVSSSTVSRWLASSRTQWLLDRARGTQGDILVVLIKSPISENASNRRTLRSLGLNRIGASRIGPRDGWFVGQVRKVAHLVRIEILGTVVDLRDEVSVMSDSLEHEMSNDADGSRAFRGGEFIEWHRIDDARSLIWSSDLSLEDLLAKTVTVLGEPDDRYRGVVDVADERASATTARKAYEIAISHPDLVTFLRLNFGPSTALVWSPAPGTPDLARLSRFAEASLVFSAEKPELVEETLRETATRKIGEIATEIVSHVAA